MSKTKITEVEEPVHDYEYDAVVIGWQKITTTVTEGEFIPRPEAEIKADLAELDAWWAKGNK